MDVEIDESEHVCPLESQHGAPAGLNHEAMQVAGRGHPLHVSLRDPHEGRHLGAGQQIAVGHLIGLEGIGPRVRVRLAAG
jgi:hypothetical protein